MRSMLDPVMHAVTNSHPPYKRLMAFADGENLVARFQYLCTQGKVPHPTDIKHCKDVFVWSPGFIPSLNHMEVLRATYYTAAVGDEDLLDRIRDDIKELTFTPYSRTSSPALPTTVWPHVAKRKADARQTKGVDIKLAVDALAHLYRNNFDIALLMTGDGDFLPVVDEIQRSGKLCYIAAFSSGLNPKLKRLADRFFNLDSCSFK